MKGVKKRKNGKERINYSARALEMTSLLIGSAKKHIEIDPNQKKNDFLKKNVFPVHPSISEKRFCMLSRVSEKWTIENLQLIG
jgi:hypothetical protein